MAHAFLGVETVPGKRGVLIQGIAKGGPAAKADLRRGDVIVSLDGTRIEGPDALARAVAAHRPGQAVALRFLRHGREDTTRVTLANRPA